MSGQLLLGVIDAVAHLAPALLLLALLVAGRYPGERAAARRIAHRPRIRSRPSVRAHRPRGPLVDLPRGGALLAAGLAGRAPPAVPR